MLLCKEIWEFRELRKRRLDLGQDVRIAGRSISALIRKGLGVR
jgi:hypothetical protein